MTAVLGALLIGATIGYWVGYALGFRHGGKYVVDAIEKEFGNGGG